MYISCSKCRASEASVTVMFDSLRLESRYAYRNSKDVGFPDTLSYEFVGKFGEARRQSTSGVPYNQPSTSSSQVVSCEKNVY